MVFKVNYGSDDSKRFLYDKKNGLKAELVFIDEYKDNLLKSDVYKKLDGYKNVIPYVIRYFASYYLNP